MLWQVWGAGDAGAALLCEVLCSGAAMTARSLPPPFLPTPQLLHAKRQEVESQESSTNLQLLLLFLERVRSGKAGQLSELQAQLACLERDLAAIEPPQQPPLPAPPASALAATAVNLHSALDPAGDTLQQQAGMARAPSAPTLGVAALQPQLNGQPQLQQPPAQPQHQDAPPTDGFCQGLGSGGCLEEQRPGAQLQGQPPAGGSCSDAARGLANAAGSQPGADYVGGAAPQLLGGLPGTLAGVGAAGAERATSPAAKRARILSHMGELEAAYLQLRGGARSAQGQQQGGNAGSKGEACAGGQQGHAGGAAHGMLASGPGAALDGDTALTAFSQMLTAATHFSRMQLVATLPPAAQRGAGVGSGCAILSSIVFDAEDRLFATAGGSGAVAGKVAAGCLDSLWLGCCRD